MEVQIGVAKINKYASSESGDTLEVIERPNGGLSVVLADGQRSGKSAKRISNIVVRKVISLLAEGVRDGAAARAASDYLFTERGGKVQSTLNILSIDLTSNTLVITRNNPAPMLIAQNGTIKTLDEESQSVGVRRDTRPVITEAQIEEGLLVVAYSDGLVHAGDRVGQHLDVSAELQGLLDEDASPQQIADGLMDKAMQLDDGRPIDDISVVVLAVTVRNGDDIRRMSMRLPIR
ncbi:MAG: serine/threonine-protein phosphatase [Chloroflexi bacterium]|nr:MAG: serine/threonine-protein phosphatase [Chloroflexota bacterium]MBL1196085.1 serine/threonine-protein phosphatase [Chloroflexota bacterium]NOH13378.1 SpoIIE family protein phosphatase [Chloroflexota bacterium]